MLSRATLRASPRTVQQLVARRGFHASRPRMGSDYHYPEGPRSNIPFNPLTRFFWLRYTLYCVAGFGAPFGIAVWQTYKN